MFLKILIGIIGLGVVVFIHELGHFLAARAMGIDVEAFSIGWGRPLLKRKIGGVEYRLGMFPVGGYCQMRGEAEFREALTHDKTEIPRDKGTFYGTSPLRRIFVAFAGPAANALFAVIVLAFVWGIGFEVTTLGNRIVLASDLELPLGSQEGTPVSELYPADEAGMKSGDKIVEIAGKTTANYQDVQEAIAPNAEKELSIIVEREGTRIPLLMVPKLDKATGAGKIGVYFWTDPLVSALKPSSPAAIAGIQVGDRIISANNIPIPYSVALMKVLASRPNTLNLLLERQGIERSVELVLSYDDAGNTDIGIEFETLRFNTPRLGFFAALSKGAEESWKTFALSIKSFSLLFRGVDLTKAVSGPVRITYMVGDVASEGFGQGFGAGISALASFLALLSVALCIMNLLPIPALDGGLILLFLFEAIARKPLRPKFIYGFQMTGTALIFGLLLFSVFGDILFLIGR
ncbi:RIP metalloprotease RseP [Treponema sp.]